jgi:Jacalin-like lectin domain
MSLRQSGTAGRAGHGSDQHPVNEPDLLSRGSIFQVNVRHGKYVDAIQMEFMRNGTPEFGQFYGADATSGRLDNFPVEVSAGDYIVELFGRAGDVVDSINFRTAAGIVSPQYGGDDGNGGDDFSLKANPGEEIIGLYGLIGEDDQNDNRIVWKQIGVYFRTRP